MGDPSFLETLAKTVTDLREKNPNIKYVCDPVMGDDGQFYVPEVSVSLSTFQHHLRGVVVVQQCLAYV